jgi:hypothetical protein
VVAAASAIVLDTERHRGKPERKSPAMTAGLSKISFWIN